MNDHIDTNLQECAAVIAAFGGIRPMAHKLGVPVSTVQGWKQRNAIPANRVANIFAAAKTHNVDLTDITGTHEPVGVQQELATESPVNSRSQPQTGVSAWKQSDRGAFFIAVIALIAAIAAGGWSVLSDRQGVDFTEIAERLTLLETEPRTGDTGKFQQQFADDLAKLRTALDRIAKKQVEFAGPNEDIGRIIDRFEETETEIDWIQAKAAREAKSTKAAVAAAQSEIANLREQLSTIGETRSDPGRSIAGSIGMALAVGRLQRALDNGSAYENVLVSLRALSVGDDTVSMILDRLAVRATTGAPTRDALLQSFPGIARNIVATADTEAARGWTERTWHRIRNTVSIRRIGADVPGDTPGAQVARAEAKLNVGDLGGAVAELDGLTGAAATTAATWLVDAQSRRDVEVAVGELEALAIARLQADSGGS